VNLQTAFLIRRQAFHILSMRSINAFDDARSLTAAEFHERKKDGSIAAANWMASALVVGKDFGTAYLWIPARLQRSHPEIKGEPLADVTDLNACKERACYQGALRTISPLSLIQWNEWRTIRISSESSQ